MSDIYQILVVEPDAQLQRVCSDALLGVMNAQIQSVQSGRSGYETAQQMPRVDLLITEAVMPEIDGINLYATLKQAFPALKCVVLTEYDLSAYAGYLGDSQVLPKPFDVAGLRGSILQVAPHIEFQAPRVAVVEGAEMQRTQPIDISVIQARLGQSRSPKSAVQAAPQSPQAARPKSAVQAAPVAMQPTVVSPSAETQPRLPMRAKPSARVVGVPQGSGPVARVVAAPVEEAAAPVEEEDLGMRTLVRGASPVDPERIGALQAEAKALAKSGRMPVLQPDPPAQVRGGTPVTTFTAPISTVNPAAAAAAAAGIIDVPTPTPGGRPDPGKGGEGGPWGSTASSSAPLVDDSFFDQLQVNPLSQSDRASGKIAVEAAAPSATSIYGAAGKSVAGRPKQVRKSMSAAVPDAIRMDQIKQGMEIGNYTLLEKLPRSEWGPAFVAIQHGVNRQVRLTFFDASQSEHPAQEFADYFRMLISRQHVNLLTVFEVSQAQGLTFVSDELWMGSHFCGLTQSATYIDARSAASLMEQVTSALTHIADTPARLLTDTDILISQTGVVKLNHLHPNRDCPIVAPSEQLAELARLVGQVLDIVAQQEPLLVEYLQLLSSGSIPALDAYNRAVDLGIRLAPEQQIEQTVEQQETETVVKKTRAKQKTTIWIFGAIGALIFIGLGAAIWFMMNQKPFTDFKAMQEVPAGDFTNSLGQTVTLPEFYIDQYEVTIYQYNNFLKAINASGKSASTFMVEGTPSSKTSLIPADWAKIVESIKNKSPYPKFGEEITYDTPIFNIDYYDAAAYAKWIGKRLPTADEWEKAAAGADNLPFPWGADADPKRANTGADYDPADSNKGGDIDGFRGFAPENRIAGDVSPYGVHNMYGNVSEWTSSVGKPKLGIDTRLVKGFNFASPLPLKKLAEATESRIPDRGEAWVGFRCASDKPPAADK